MRIFLLISLSCWNVAAVLGQEVASANSGVFPLEAAFAEAAKAWPTKLPGLRLTQDPLRVSHIVGEGPDAKLVLRRIDSGEEEIVFSRAEWERACESAKIAPGDPGDLAALEWRSSTRLEAVLPGRILRADLEPLRVSELVKWPVDSSAHALSPDRKCVAYVREFNVFVVGADGATVTVTRGGYEDLTHGVSVSRVEFGITEGLFWSPDGLRLAFYREDLRPIRGYPSVELHRGPATSKTWRYPMAGQAGSRIAVGIYDQRSKQVTWLATDPDVDEYLTNLAWHPGSEHLVVSHVNRAQDREDVVEYDARTGLASRTLLVESDPEWQEPLSPIRYLPDGSGRFLRFSDRSGFRHLDLHASSGAVEQAVTAGALDLIDFLAFDPAEPDSFWVTTTGPDPRQRHLYRGRIRGDFVPVTTERGSHEIELSADGGRALDAWSNLETPLVVQVIDLKSGKKCAPLPIRTDPWQGFVGPQAKFFETKTADDQTMYGLMLLPKETKGAPVVHYVYGGPHVQLVQDAWRGGKSRWNLWLHALAARGYIVFFADNRGTAFRGEAWQQSLHRRLGTIEVDDQLAALEFVLDRTGADRKRVGVTGWSYGGYLSLCLAVHGKDRYAVAMAGAPVTNWALYETGYGERYLDRPFENEEGYRVANPAHHLAGLSARTLIIQGSADDTVVMQHAYEFVDACVQARVPVDLLVYPGQAHGFRGPAFEHAVRRMTDHLDQFVGRPSAPGR